MWLGRGKRVSGRLVIRRNDGAILTGGSDHQGRCAEDGILGLKKVAPWCEK